MEKEPRENEYAQTENLESHQPFLDAWRKTVYMNFLFANKLLWLVDMLKTELDRMMHVIYHLGPINHPQYNNRNCKKYHQLVLLMNKVIDTLNQANYFASSYRDFVRIDGENETNLRSKVDQDPCDIDILSWELRFLDQMPIWLVKELKEEGVLPEGFDTKSYEWNESTVGIHL